MDADNRSHNYIVNNIIFGAEVQVEDVLVK